MADAKAESAAVLEKKTTDEMPGVDMPFPLKDYGGDLEAWAADVQTTLLPAHQSQVEKIRLQTSSLGCPCCRGDPGGCGRCYWPKAVRYWRRVETGGKYAAVEGYEKMIPKSKTAMELDK